MFNQVSSRKKKNQMTKMKCPRAIIKCPKKVQVWISIAVQKQSISKMSVSKDLMLWYKTRAQSDHKLAIITQRNKTKFITCKAKLKRSRAARTMSSTWVIMVTELLQVWHQIKQLVPNCPVSMLISSKTSRTVKTETEQLYMKMISVLIFKTLIFKLITSQLKVVKALAGMQMLKITKCCSHLKEVVFKCWMLVQDKTWTR